MRRRSFLRAAVAAVAGLLGLQQRREDMPPAGDRLAIHRREGGAWERVRMHELRPGDIVHHERHGVWRVTGRPVYLEDQATWMAHAIRDPDDPIQSLPKPAGV